MQYMVGDKSRWRRRRSGGGGGDHESEGIMMRGRGEN